MHTKYIAIVKNNNGAFVYEPYLVESRSRFFDRIAEFVIQECPAGTSWEFIPCAE